MIANLQALGVHELTFEEQRALVGGGWIARVAGWAVGAFLGGIANLGEAMGEAAGDFVNGFAAGYSEARAS